MIVNPQFFNYRFTIGTLVIAFTGLAIFGYVRYEKIKSERDFTVQEKKLLQNDISEIISIYDKLEQENDSFNLVFNNVNKVLEVTSDSLGKIKANRKAVLKRYKNDLKSLEEEKDSLEAFNDTLLNTVAEIDKEKASLEAKAEISFNEVATPNLKLIKNSFKAKGYQVKNNKLIRSRKANKVNTLEVCFELESADYADAVDFYIQVIDPKNNVVSDQGVAKFGESTLIYSLKTKANSNTICENIVSNYKLPKGIYYVNVFGDQNQLGSTQIKLY